MTGRTGRWSRAPYIDMLIPSQIDPTMAPEGKHYMSVFVQYAPYQLADGAVDGRAPQGLRARRSSTPSAQHSPNFKDLMLHAEIRTPWDIENEVGLTEGNIFQGELTLRPAAVQPPDPRLCAVPRAGAGHVHVWLEHASGRRRDGRARAQRRAARFCAMSARQPERDVRSRRQVELRRIDHRRRPQRPGVRRVSGAQPAGRVLVLEAASMVGGAAITREFAPGFQVSACAHLLHLMPQAI